MLPYTRVGEAKNIFFFFADPSARIVQFDDVSLEVTDPGLLQMITYTRVGEAKNIFCFVDPGISKEDKIICIPMPRLHL